MLKIAIKIFCLKDGKLFINIHAFFLYASKLLSLSYVIQIENEVVVIVAIKSSISPLLSAVPLIVSCILERHSLLIDTIVMVNKDQLPKKYNGEKRRRKVLAMYKRKEM